MMASKKKNRKKAAPRPKRASDRSEAAPIAGSVLARAWSMWQSADWDALASIPLSEIKNDPHRAQVSLLMAAAQTHVGCLEAARASVSKALSRGVDRHLAVRVMMSAAQNSLGCAAAALEDKSAPSHFQDAVRLVKPDADIELSGRIRQIRETARLGFLPDAIDAIEKQFELIRDSPADDETTMQSLASSLTVVKAEVRALEKSRLLYQPPARHLPDNRPRSEITAPFVVVVAGVPRSGSTWVYNAARLICKAAHLDAYSCWVADYEPEAHAGSDLHIVKLHNAEQLTFPYHRLLTTQRNLDERLASLLRMGWIGSTPEAILNAAKGHAALHAYWAGRTDLEVSYDEIQRSPETALEKIADRLDLPLRASDNGLICRSLSGMKAPETQDGNLGHDETTLLHPGHRAGNVERNEALQTIRAVLADGGL